MSAASGGSYVCNRRLTPSFSSGRKSGRVLDGRRTHKIFRPSCEKSEIGPMLRTDMASCKLAHSKTVAIVRAASCSRVRTAPSHEQRPRENGITDRDVHVGDVEDWPVLQVHEVDDVAAEDPVQVVADCAG